MRDEHDRFGIFIAMLMGVFYAFECGMAHGWRVWVYGPLAAVCFGLVMYWVARDMEPDA